MTPPIAIAERPPSPPRAYLSQPNVLWPILGAFPLIALPLAYITLFPPTVGLKWFAAAYLWSLGISHFLITFTLYLNSKNLQYFASTAMNKLVYFGVPATIFLYFGGVSLIDEQAHPGITPVIHTVSAIVMIANFLHLGRQSFGVLQMLKGQSGLVFDAEMRKLELSFFFVMPMLQAETAFLGDGRFLRGSWLVWATVAFAAVIFLAIVRYALRAQPSPALEAANVSLTKKKLVPLSYFFMQTGSAWLAILDVRLYLAANAIHYTEYHALMYPRVVHSELGDTWVDRFMARIRRPPFLFYGLLLTGSAITVAFLGDHFGFRKLVDDGPRPFGFFFNMLNGIFLFHYFVEAFIWKFSNPYYRGALSKLYFKR
jgi:hypothetical protein